MSKKNLKVYRTVFVTEVGSMQFKVKFPNNEHVFDVEPKDYAEVCKMVEDFLKEDLDQTDLKQ